MDLKEKNLDSTKIYSGKILDLYKDKVLCPNGNEAYREYVKHSGASCILAIINGKIILEKQYRYPVDEILYELPAGKLDPNEEPVDCAMRELEEETGYRALSINSLGNIYSTCGFSNEKIHLFYTDNLIKTKTNFDPDEFVELEFFTLEEINQMILDNKIVDSKTICAIHKYQMIFKGLK